MYGVMPWVGDRLGLGAGSGRNDILRVAEQVLDLQRERWAQARVVSEAEMAEIAQNLKA